MSKGRGKEISKSLSNGNRAQQPPLGRRVAQVWWGGCPSIPAVGAHPRIFRGVVLETSKSQDIFPPIATRKQERRWREHREKFLLLTHHATREEGRSLTHLWSVLQTTRKTVHFSQTRPGHQTPPCLQPGHSRAAPGAQESLPWSRSSRGQGTHPVTFPQ